MEPQREYHTFKTTASAVHDDDSSLLKFQGERLIITGYPERCGGNFRLRIMHALLHASHGRSALLRTPFPINQPWPKLWNPRLASYINRQRTKSSPYGVHTSTEFPSATKLPLRHAYIDEQFHELLSNIPSASASRHHVSETTALCTSATSFGPSVSKFSVQS